MSGRKAKKKRPGFRPRRYTPIEKHKRDKKLLVPPFATYPNLKPSSWVDERLPDLIWCALLITRLGRDRGHDIIRFVANQNQDIGKEVGIPDATLSAIAQWSESRRTKVLKNICCDEGCRVALKPLLLFSDLPAREDWRSAISFEPGDDDWEHLKVAVANCIDHQSDVSTGCRWARVLIMLASGKLRLGSDDEIQNVLNYPQRGDLTIVRPWIRATELSFSAATANPDMTWPRSFWQQCFHDTKCADTLRYTPDAAIMVGTTRQRVQEIRKQVAERFYDTLSGTSVDPKHDAMFGLAAYSLAMLDELLNIGTDKSILGRFGLRAIVYAYITLAYLSDVDSEELWLAYRTYGSGQAKLAFLKLDQEVGTKPHYVDVEVLEGLANEDQWMEFQSIDLGQWANTSLRDMSIKTDLKETYDQFYPWTSAFAHANWAATRNAIFGACLNPLHRLHRILLPDTTAQGDVVPDAVLLVDEILKILDRAYGCPLKVST